MQTHLHRSALRLLHVVFRLLLIARIYTLEMKSRVAVTVVAALLVVCVSAIGAGAPIQITPEAITWREGPPTIPPDARSAILEGDPKGEGIFTMRVSFPPNYFIPLHTHGRDERITVIGGTVYVGIGDSVDRSKEVRYGAGSFYVTPTPLRHWVRAGEKGAVIQATSIGPWTVEYVDPADDPGRASK